MTFLFTSQTCWHDFPIYHTNGSLMVCWLFPLSVGILPPSFICVTFCWHVSANALTWCWHDFPTGWRRLTGCPKSQIIFHKRATKYRSLLRKMTYKDKGSYESSPPCIYHTNGWLMVCWLFPLSVGVFWHVHSNAVFERDAGCNRQFVHEHGLYSRTQVCLSKYMCMLVGVCVGVYLNVCIDIHICKYIYIYIYI